MTDPTKPILSDDCDLTKDLDIDLNSILALFSSQRLKSPIVRPSTQRQITEFIGSDFPETGTPDFESLVKLLNDVTDTFPRRNTHPGFFGWVAPSGLPTDPVANAIVASLNENVGGYKASPVGTTIEKQVISWLAELAGLPLNSEGVLLSGGSMANTTAMASALAHRFGPDYYHQGLAAFQVEGKPVVICSKATHFSIKRAAVMLGIGADNVIAVDVDADYRMSIEHLSKVIDQYENIVCVIGTAGTTMTGAIDPLQQIAELCQSRSIWFHVDAAYGAGGLMSRELQPRYQGLELADSVTMDLHKWFFQSLDCSLLLYRNSDSARSLFYESSDYLQTNQEDVPEEFMFFHIGPELSRRFRALPIYLAFKFYGRERLAANVLHNVQCAEYLAQLINHSDDLELLVAPQLSIVCFRYIRPGLDDDSIDQLNSAIRNQIEAEGDYFMSATQLGGRPVLRLSIINHATRVEQMDGLLGRVLELGVGLCLPQALTPPIPKT
jgi:aromatic-L-amino-acid decarboxylase